MELKKYSDEEKFNVHILKMLATQLKEKEATRPILISIFIPPYRRISSALNWLDDEYKLVDGGKGKKQQFEVLASARERLSKYDSVPDNGLIFFHGKIMDCNGVKKDLVLDFEPFRPIICHVFERSTKFAYRLLRQLYEPLYQLGFIVMEGNEALFGVLKGKTREVIYKSDFGVENYVGERARQANAFYKGSDLTGLILVGSDSRKVELIECGMLSCEVKKHLLNVVINHEEIDQCFEQEIDKQMYIREKELIGKFFEEVCIDSCKYVFGIEDTTKALEINSVETLIVWDKFDSYCFKEKGYSPESVTNNRSLEGWQFCRAFSGVGAILS